MCVITNVHAYICTWCFHFSLISTSLPLFLPSFSLPSPTHASLPLSPLSYSVFPTINRSYEASRWPSALILSITRTSLAVRVPPSTKSVMTTRFASSFLTKTAPMPLISWSWGTNTRWRLHRRTSWRLYMTWWEIVSCPDPTLTERKRGLVTIRHPTRP